MQVILYISCSPKGAISISQTFADEVVLRLQKRHTNARIRRRDLAANPPSFVDADFCSAITDPNGASAPAFVESEHLIQELEQADALVIATPMHNYTVPAALKSWIDQIVRIH